MWNRRAFIKAVAVGAMGVSAMPSMAIKGNREKRLTILHTNDIHCRFEPFPENDPKYPGRGGLNRIAAYVKRMRENDPDLLLFDSGDFSQGTPYFNFFKSEVVLRLMSEMGYNAGTIGNHEFDNGLDGIAGGLPYANYPLISSNYDFAETILDGKIKKHVVLERKGIRIGVYGLGVGLNGLVDPEKSGATKNLDPVEVALEEEHFLRRDKKCDLIVCLSHLGYAYETEQVSDVVLASKTFSTDLILGGHSHTFLEKPLELKNAMGKPVTVNQAGWAALMVGQIDLLVERQKVSVFNFMENKKA